MKYTIDMLDDNARRELIENNDILGNMVYDDMIDTELFYIDEQLEHIKTALKDWSIGPAYPCYMVVKDALLFLDGLEIIQDNYCTLPDSMDQEIKTVLAARDRFRNMDMSYGNLYQLSEWLDHKAQYFADHIAKQFERNFDFSHDDMVSYFLDFYADERLNDNFYIKDNKLFRTITEEIA